MISFSVILYGLFGVYPIYRLYELKVGPLMPIDYFLQLELALFCAFYYIGTPNSETAISGSSSFPSTSLDDELNY